MSTVAAVFVDPNGCYAGLDGVELWDKKRDGRLYRGPYPGVFHPPCSTWCQIASVNEKRYGHPIGSDGGCFKSALFDVRRWGGVLEHPAFTLAWKHFEIRRPHLPGGWIPTRCGGWVCHVEQGHYGHSARKATWLLVYGIGRAQLPELQWGRFTEATAWVSQMANHGTGEGKRRLSKKAASATPPAFRDVLIAMARSASRPG